MSRTVKFACYVVLPFTQPSYMLYPNTLQLWAPTHPLLRVFSLPKQPNLTSFHYSDVLLSEFSLLSSVTGCWIWSMNSEPSNPLEVRDHPPRGLAQVPSIQSPVSNPAGPKNIPTVGRWLGYFQPWGPREWRDLCQARRPKSMPILVGFR